MNQRIKDYLVEELERSGFVLNYGIPLPTFGQERCLPFSRGRKYLISVHSGVDGRKFLPNLDAFRQSLDWAVNQGLNPLPIFDADDGFFYQDQGESSDRETSGDRRKLSNLELITKAIFGEVTYYSNSGLFVVSYGPVVANYSNVIDESKVSNPELAKTPGIIPKSKYNPTLVSIKRVTSRRNYFRFELSSKKGFGIIKESDVVFPLPIVIESSGISPYERDRGRQLADLDLEPEELTFEDQRLIASVQ